MLDSVSWLDPVGGLLVSTMVIRAGWSNTGSALLELADVGAAAEIKESVRKSALNALQKDSLGPGRIVGNQVEIRDVQGVKAGQNYLMIVELAVPGEWTVQETCLVEDAVREKIGSKVRGVRRVSVRIVAKSNGAPNFADEFIGADVSQRSSPEPEHHGHSHNLTHDHNHGVTSLNGGAKKLN